jgi:hypothetical protein
MDENTKSRSFSQKPLETVVCAIHIERQNPFSFCYFHYLSTGDGWRGTWSPSGRTSFESHPICLKLPTIMYLTNARMMVYPDCPFPPPFIAKRDMPGMASEEEKLYF